jgi:predicted transcriptional regulator
MADVFSDIEFLAGSPNRAAVLEALVDTPRDRHDLAEHVGVSRVTIGRILKDLVTRGWVASDGSRYWATPIGEVVATEFGALLDTMETMRKLSAVMEWLPPDLDIDFRRFADARITLPTWSDSVAPIRRAARLAEEATFLRVAGSGIAPDVIEGIHDAAVDGGEVTFVTTDAAFELVDSSPQMQGWLLEAMEARAALYRHPGFPYLIALCDEVAIIGVNDDAGVPRGLVESDDLAVRDWVLSTVERCRDEAERLDRSAFTT